MIRKAGEGYDLCRCSESCPNQPRFKRIMCINGECVVPEQPWYQQFPTPLPRLTARCHLRVILHTCPSHLAHTCPTHRDCVNVGIHLVQQLLQALQGGGHAVVVGQGLGRGAAR